MPPLLLSQHLLGSKRNNPLSVKQTAVLSFAGVRVPRVANHSGRKAVTFPHESQAYGQYQCVELCNRPAFINLRCCRHRTRKSSPHSILHRPVATGHCRLHALYQLNPQPPPTNMHLLLLSRDHIARARLRLSHRSSSERLAPCTTPAVYRQGHPSHGRQRSI